MNEKEAEHWFKEIFPNADFNHFLDRLKWADNDLDLAIWSIGEIRKDECIKEKTFLYLALNQKVI